MKKLIRKVINPFLPSYEVVCTNYQLIPGMPVNKNQSRHSFAKGASQEAEAFYSKVISSEITKMMAPVEIKLTKRGKTIQHTKYGPVENFTKAA
ncbi:MAG: hypothetical protein M3Q05_13100 [Bacteroidota bacterium]|nr:hypothetical protein [Bacteroidota bacterium]